MKFVYTDILKHLKEKPSINEISEKLFQLGHEHEIENDIFHMDFTPNRGDCLSLNGISRDLNIFYEKNDFIEIYSNPIKELEIDFKNLSPQYCPKISFLEIEVEKIPNEYKPYIENYFKNLDINKINFFTDISNFISYELGQPTHCYSRDTIGNSLNFETINFETHFTTLHSNKIKLVNNNCVFTNNNNEIINLAGIMGGKSTACSQDTKKVLVECAYFKPESIIGKTLKYNLNSDAAHKFERGVDYSMQEYTLRRLIKIVEDHTKIKNLSLKTYNCRDFSNHTLEIDIKRINKILGTRLDEYDYITYLSKLGFIINNSKIQVPSHRHDIFGQNDLAEEVARVVGFNQLPRSEFKIKKDNPIKGDSTINKIRHHLKNIGFTEVINYPFSQNFSENSILVDNPLDSNKKNLRTNIKNSLLKNLLYNERRQSESVKLFEISEIYTKDSVINKETFIGIIASGRQGFNYDNFSKKIDSSYLNELFIQLQSNHNFEFSLLDRNNLDTKRKDKIYYYETRLSNFSDCFKNGNDQIEKETNFIKYKKISELPSSHRDFSFSIQNIEAYEFLLEHLRYIEIEELKDCFMFDFYKNKELNELKVGFRFIFQSKEKTLSEKDINIMLEEILEPLLKFDGIHIPGYSST